MCVCSFVPFHIYYVIKENEAIQFTEGHRGRQNVFRWPKNLFLGTVHFYGVGGGGAGGI